MKNSRSGFNLIEIAIVLAVIGLVIGGIYTAASAVTENNRKQTTQKQILQIVSNIRSVYATQPGFEVPTHAQIKAMQLFPGDMPDNGTDFLSVYGYPVSLTAYNGSFPINNQQFVVLFNNLPHDTCISLMTQGFGSGQLVRQYGLLDVGAYGYLGAGVSDGVSIAEADTICGNAAYSGVYFAFQLRG